MSSNQDLVLIAASDGTLAADVRPLVRFNVSVILEQDGRREQGYSGGGARLDLNYFLEGRFADGLREGSRATGVSRARSRSCARRHHAGRPGSRLARDPAARGGRARPRGRLQSQGDVGVFWQGRAAGCLPHCTIVDDGTIPNRRGSLTIDDEGTPGQYNVLVENGILRGYMQDKLNATPDGRIAHRQRSPRVVRAYADAENDEHLHAGRTA